MKEAYFPVLYLSTGGLTVSLYYLPIPFLYSLCNLPVFVSEVFVGSKHNGCRMSSLHHLSALGIACQVIGEVGGGWWGKVGELGFQFLSVCAPTHFLSASLRLWTCLSLPFIPSPSWVS